MRQKIEVTSVTGQKIQLLHPSEKQFYEEAQAKYLAEYTFTHENDKRQVDRLLMLEVQCQRYQWYTLAGIDYEATLLSSREESEYRKAIKEISAQITELQKELGVTKAEREKATQQADSVGAYITNLLQRAKEFGVMREEQSDRALELMNELIAMVGAYKRSNENERRKLGIENAEAILDWITEYLEPAYNEIDEHFRNKPDGQRYWVRTI
ncbi:hypothetical protein GCM10028801_30920 [Nocardioides maradonensis]